jgi:hypothetical protein
MPAAACTEADICPTDSARDASSSANQGDFFDSRIATCKLNKSLSFVAMFVLKK